uniref:Uncharacterized protein n=1 Tax=Rhizophora mucronata TaxID=61149 RepID=A0A2P2NU41_RHIMU
MFQFLWRLAFKIKVLHRSAASPTPKKAPKLSLSLLHLSHYLLLTLGPS